MNRVGDDFAVDYVADDSKVEDGAGAASVRQSSTSSFPSHLRQLKGAPVEAGLGDTSGPNRIASLSRSFAHAGGQHDFHPLTVEEMTKTEQYYEGVGRYPGSMVDSENFSYFGSRRMFCQEHPFKTKEDLCDLVNQTISCVLKNIPSKNPLVIHSFGSNGLFLEHMLVNSLQALNYDNLSLRLVDPAYNQAMAPVGTYYEALRNARVDFPHGKKPLEIQLYSTISVYALKERDKSRVLTGDLQASHIILQGSEPIELDYSDDAQVSVTRSQAATRISEANIERAESVYVAIQPNNIDGRDELEQQMKRPYVGDLETYLLFSLTPDQIALSTGNQVPQEVSTYLRESINRYLAGAHQGSEATLPIKKLNDAVKKSVIDLQKAQPDICAKSTPVADYRAGYRFQKGLLQNADGPVIVAELDLGEVNVSVMPKTAT